MELLVVGDLYVVPAGVLGLVASIGVVVSLIVLIVLHLLRDETRLVVVLGLVLLRSWNELILSLHGLVHVLHFESGSKLAGWNEAGLVQLLWHHLTIQVQGSRHL